MVESKPTKSKKDDSDAGPEKGGLKRELDRELDRLEARIEEVRVLFEQHFVDVLPQPPTKLQSEVVRTIRSLLRAPFKNSATRFRLRMLVQRFQTYATYWERIQKLREEGKYNRDLFKAELREKMLEDAQKAESRLGKAEQGLKQLYSTYEAALKKAGSKDKLDFDRFKDSLLKKAKVLKEQHGISKLNYKIAIKEGKVVIKASPKKPK